MIKCYKKSDYDEILENLIVSNGFYKKHNLGSHESYAAEIGREYIINELLYLLNRLNELTEEELKRYLLNSDELLEDIISFAKEKKGWCFDKLLALRFCRCVVVDYINGKIKSDEHAESSIGAIEQLVDIYDDEHLCYRMNDKKFIEFYDCILDIYDESEVLKFYYKGEDVLRRVVARRMLIHDMCC